MALVGLLWLIASDSETLRDLALLLWSGRIYEMVQILSRLAFVGGIVGLYATGALGTSWLARAGTVLAIAGYLLEMLGGLGLGPTVEIPSNGEVSMAYPLAEFAPILGMTLISLAAIPVGKLPRSAKICPFLIGVWPAFEFAVLLLVRFDSSDAINILSNGLELWWGMLWIALGIALFSLRGVSHIRAYVVPVPDEMASGGTDAATRHVRR
jgi:hypothetical protein